MGVLDQLGLGQPDDRRAGLVEVRLSAHACARCGSMVALDLADRHWAWHEALKAAAGPAGAPDLATVDQE